MTNTTKMISVALIGALLGAAVLSIINVVLNTAEHDVKNNKPISTPSKQAPLYWVAPMDANYRRDKPGKSPMGMDLVPVYPESSESNTMEVGTVTIAPQVVNNLGVRIAPVEVKVMKSTISTVGYVQYDENKLVHIHPRVDGWIEKLYIKAAGEPVKKDQAIYTLYSPQLVNAQEEFLIALKRNNKTLISAAKARLSALQLSTKFITTLEKTRKVQQTITFYAPQSGVVDGLQVREGFYVKPGTTLMSIGQLDHVWVEAEVFERDAALVKQGLTVLMTLDYLPGKKWQGVVDYVYPTLNVKTRTLRVRLTFNNPDFQLKPNMFAQVAIHSSSKENTILVPKEAVIRTGKQDRVVLALGQGQFKSIEVIIGRVNDNFIEILEGLSGNEVVVTSAQFLIDSESSKSSDFKRMAMLESTETELASAMNMNMNMKNEVSSATVLGVINAIDKKNRTLNISREAIEKWNRPAARFDFLVTDAIDIQALTIGMKVRFTFEVRDDLVIIAISPQNNPANSMNQQQMSVEHAEH